MSAMDNARADDEPKVRIYVNSNSHMSRGKYAAAAVHAALTAAGVHPGLPVVVLGAQRDHVVKHTTVIHDAGRTEVEPGTPTAGTDWEPEPNWEYVPGHRWVDRDGVEHWFVQSGTIAHGYVNKYISEGGEVIRRVVGPWETVEAMPTEHTNRRQTDAK